MSDLFPSLLNYFVEVKIKNDHMIDKMEDRVKHNRNYSAILATLQGSENGRVVTIGVKHAFICDRVWKKTIGDLR
jgi:hypothetical protein